MGLTPVADTWSSGICSTSYSHTHARAHTHRLSRRSKMEVCGFALLRYPWKTGRICLDRLQLWWMALRFCPTMPLTSLLSHEQMVPFTPASHVHAHTHTCFPRMPSLRAAMCAHTQGGLMNSAPHEVSALSWGVHLQIWRATKQNIRLWVWNVKQTNKGVIEWSRE